MNMQNVIKRKVYKITQKTCFKITSMKAQIPHTERERERRKEGEHTSTASLVPALVLKQGFP